MKRVLFKPILHTFLLALAAAFIAGPLYAQDNTSSILIIKKTIDENGDVKIEKYTDGDVDMDITIDGENLEDISQSNDVEIRELESIQDLENEMDIKIDIQDSGNSKIFRFDTDHVVEGLRNIEIDVEGHQERLEDIFENLGNEVNSIRWNKTTSNAAFLGVYLESKPSETAGALVTDVIKETAAEENGMMAGDLITAIDREKVMNTSELITKRDGKKMSKKIELGAKKSFQLQSNNFNGMQNWYLNNDNHRQFNIGSCAPAKPVGFLGVVTESVAEGAKVTKVVDGSSAQNTGMLVGDVLTEINGTEITGQCSVTKAMRSTKPSETVSVSWKRDGIDMTKQVTLGEKKNSLSSMSIQKSVFPGKLNRRTQRGIVVTPKTPQNLNVSPAKINGLRFSEMEMFPNPTSSNLFLKFATDSKVATTIQILDVNGKKVFEDKVNDFDGSYEREFDLSQYPSGNYFLNIIQGDEIFTEKVVVK